ncbi:disease resistance protein At4g27190-like [Neltuma alba]|uniref:disease resistance protein At4g27190-like n=1 Tax=Neltuma alba TaxID=207710 RepID=UPI0010A587B1|nr:disease resistance protein At4g27190-like [Prosopis alba]
MDSNDIKAHAVTKMEPSTKQALDPSAELEEIETTETFDFTKGEKVVPLVNPFSLPKLKLPNPRRIETNRHYSSKAKALEQFGIPLSGPMSRLLLKVSRIRDFIRLLLNYPMRTVHHSKLKAWIQEASSRRHSLDDLDRLVSQKPLECFQGLLPMHILKSVESGWSPNYAYSNGTPEDILNLSANLAVDQLVQTLLSKDDHVRNIHHVQFSARDAAEKRLVKEKIESALKDKEIMLRLHETFSRILLIDTSDYQGPTAEIHVQQQIAQQLHLPLIEGNDDLLKASIEKEMSRKKYLVLLVDGEAKKPLDPRKAGFPEELAGVVVCITTESSKQANSDLTVAMDLNINTTDHLLPWEVFCANIGIPILPSSHARMAVRIVKECGAHLLACVIVARSLRNAKCVSQWKHALVKLSSLHHCYDIGMFRGQSSVLHKAFINFIWLDLSETQKCCLTSCLFVSKFWKPENELINYWISSQLVGAGEAKHNLTELVERFALLQSEDKKPRHIQIPRDLYDILQLLNTQNPRFLKKSELGLVEPPKSELWHTAIYIDLADNKLSELPFSPNCHELKVLKLHNNADLTKIPPHFFFKMPQLCVLDLSYTSIRELPNSFFELEQLRELHMKSCECFMKLSSEVRKLKNLEKIDLDKTQIIHLPKEIQELTNLQSLTLSLYEYRGKKSKEYTSSAVIPSGVISKLKGLKHLSIDVNPDDERWEENLQVILPELWALECLQTISLYIPALELLNLMPARIFELDFRFIVGRHMSRIISGALPTVEEKFKQSECSVKFVKGVDVPYEITSVVRHSKALFLDRHMTIKDLSKFGMTSIEQLQVCILAECKEMQTIVDGRCSSSKDILPRLLVLRVSYMKNLRSICEGEVHSSHSFGMLKTLALHNCSKLTTVFTLDFLGNLSLLKMLVVKDCPKIGALITYGPTKPGAGTFLPKLRTIALLHLPELISISNGLHMGPSLENIGIYNCPKLQRLSKMELSSQNLKAIKGEAKWWKALMWSEAEWGTVGRPSVFDCIFSPINKQDDIMSQLELDDDIDDCPGKSN